MIGPRGNAPVILAAAIALMAIIAVLSLLPGNPQPGDSEIIWLVSRVPPTFQNAMHVTLYAVLSILWLQWLGITGRASLPAQAATLTAIFAFGTGLESLQLMVPGRYASLTDAGLNLIGTLAGAAISRLLSGRGGASSSSPGEE
jgi:VanZ family protein